MPRQDKASPGRRNTCQPVRVSYPDKPRKKPKVYISIEEAARETGNSSSTISNIVSGSSSNPKPKYDTDGNLIKFSVAFFKDLSPAQKERVAEIDFQWSSFWMIPLDNPSKRVRCRNTRVAERATGIRTTLIANILEPKSDRLSAYDVRKKRRVTFVATDATEDEIREHLEGVSRVLRKARMGVQGISLPDASCC